MQKKFLITFLFKEGAGPIFTLEMAKGLASNGCQVYAVVSSKISNRLDWENCSALKEVYFLETGSKSNQLRATISFLFHDRNRIAKHFKKIRFDYVISTFYHPWTSTLMKCFKGRKLVICHDPIHHSGVGKMEEVLTTHYIKSADQVLVLTQSFVPLVEKRFGYAKENILYMPHGRMSSYVTHSLNQTSTFDEGKSIFCFLVALKSIKG